MNNFSSMAHTWQTTKDNSLDAEIKSTGNMKGLQEVRETLTIQPQSLTRTWDQSHSETGGGKWMEEERNHA